MDRDESLPENDGLLLASYVEGRNDDSYDGACKLLRDPLSLPESGVRFGARSTSARWCNLVFFSWGFLKFDDSLNQLNNKISDIDRRYTVLVQIVHPVSAEVDVPGAQNWPPARSIFSRCVHPLSA